MPGEKSAKETLEPVDKTASTENLCESDRRFARIVANVWEFDLPWDSLCMRHHERLNLERIQSGHEWVKNGSRVWCPQERDVFEIH